MSVSYKGGPSKFNPITLFIVGGCLLGLYCLVRFVPAYWTKWEMTEALRETCTQLYAMKRYGGRYSADKLQLLEEGLHRKMSDLGIDDTEATVEFPEDEPDFVVARASYSIVINHPIGRPTVLHFSPEARMDSTPPDWDKKKK